MHHSSIVTTRSDGCKWPLTGIHVSVNVGTALANTRSSKSTAKNVNEVRMSLAKGHQHSRAGLHIQS